MVQEHDRRVVRSLRQCSIEPLESLVVDLAVVVIDAGRVDRDQTHVVVVDHILDGALSRKIGMRCPERLAERLALVVVARYQQQRDVELGEDRREQFVLLGSTVIGEIARREHHVGSQLHRIEIVDGGSQLGVRVDELAHVVVGLGDVKVRDLGDQHTPRLLVVPTTNMCADAAISAGSDSAARAAKS